jgi:hypothetical protein
VARLLVLGGASDRVLALTRDLAAEGHAVRVVTADESAREPIERAGGEAWIGDPDVVGTLRYALDNVTLLVHALGDDDRPELHGSRLEMLLERTIDTTVRGVVYEDGPGRATLERMATYNEIPYRVVAPAGDDWVVRARDAIEGLLAR